MAFSRTYVHSKVATLPDQAGVEINKGEWNANHNVAISGAVSGGIPFFDSTTTENTSALLTSGSPVLGGGAGTAPFTDAGFTTTGSGATLVATLNGLTVTAAPTFSALTATRIPFAGTSGLLGDSANLIFRATSGANSPNLVVGDTANIPSIGINNTGGGGAMWGIANGALANDEFFVFRANPAIGNAYLYLNTTKAVLQTGQSFGWGASGILDSNLYRVSAGVIGASTTIGAGSIGTLQGHYNSSDGTAGISFAAQAVTSITVKDGLIVAKAP